MLQLKDCRPQQRSRSGVRQLRPGSAKLKKKKGKKKKALENTAHFILISSFQKFVLWMGMLCNVHAFTPSLNKAFIWRPWGYSNKESNCVALMELIFSWEEANNKEKA